jgi:hypothetical protein
MLSFMETLSPMGVEVLATDQVRKLKRSEFERMGADGYFEDERVELLCGVVVARAPPSEEHTESVLQTFERLFRALDDRASVRVQAGYGASDESRPKPDVYVTDKGTYWRASPEHAFGHRDRADVAAA